ncbi:hypothetical protein K456DRAFT_1658313 [Colletotrichum gloeosporioides 23]|nr:hypothetical protein K456DRAFT_1658313 [Colletotrichum gloeosporioides 23]
MIRPHFPTSPPTILSKRSTTKCSPTSHPVTGSRHHQPSISISGSFQTAFSSSPRGEDYFFSSASEASFAPDVRTGPPANDLITQPPPPNFYHILDITPQNHKSQITTKIENIVKPPLAKNGNTYIRLQIIHSKNNTAQKKTRVRSHVFLGGAVAVVAPHQERVLNMTPDVPQILSLHPRCAGLGVREFVCCSSAGEALPPAFPAFPPLSAACLASDSSPAVKGGAGFPHLAATGLLSSVNCNTASRTKL